VANIRVHRHVNRVGGCGCRHSQDCEGMMGTYVQVTRSDTPGSYVQRIEDVRHALDGELDDCTEVGVSITFTVINMTDEEYEKLSEFQGW
jgi:hypothetical protein